MANVSYPQNDLTIKPIAIWRCDQVRTFEEYKEKTGCDLDDLYNSLVSDKSSGAYFYPLKNIFIITQVINDESYSESNITIYSGTYKVNSILEYLRHEHDNVYYIYLSYGPASIKMYIDFSKREIYNSYTWPE